MDSSNKEKVPMSILDDLQTELNICHELTNEVEELAVRLTGEYREPKENGPDPGDPVSFVEILQSKVLFVHNCRLRYENAVKRLIEYF
jgi:hypothetical protein